MPGTGATVVYKVEGDITGLEVKMAQAEKAIAKTGAAAKKLEQPLNSSAKASKNLADSVLNQLGPAGDVMQNALGNVGKGAEEAAASQALAVAGAAALVLGAVKVGTVGVKAYQDYAREVRKTAEAQKISVEAASRFLGGPILSEGDVQQAERLSEDWRDINDFAHGVTVEIGQGIVPGLSSAVDLAKDLGGALGAAVSALPGDFGLGGVIGLAQKLDPIVGTLTRVDDSVNKLRGDLDLLGTAGPKGVGTTDVSKLGDKIARELKGRVDAEKDHASNLDKIRSATEGAASADRAYADANERVARGQEGVAQAQGDLNDLLRKGKVDAEQVASATKGLTDARKAQADATQNVLDKQKQLDELLHPTARDQTEAQIGVREADRALEEAKQRVKDLADSYDTTDASKWGEVQRAVADAQDDVTKATFGQQDAQKALNDILHPEQTQAVADARRDLQGATDAAADATDRVREAERKRREAMAGDPDFEKKVAGARRDVAAANRDLARDTDAVKDAALRQWEAHEKVNESLRGQIALVPEVMAEWDKFAAAHPEAAAAVAPLVGAFGASAGSATNAPSPLTIIVQGSLIHQDDLPKVVQDALVKANHRYGAVPV